MLPSGRHRGEASAATWTAPSGARWMLRVATCNPRPSKAQKDPKASCSCSRLPDWCFQMYIKDYPSQCPLGKNLSTTWFIITSLHAVDMKKLTHSDPAPPCACVFRFPPATALAMISGAVATRCASAVACRWISWKSPGSVTGDPEWIEWIKQPVPACAW